MNAIPSVTGCAAAAACLLIFATPLAAQEQNRQTQKPADEVLTFVVEHDSDGDGTIDHISTTTNSYDRQGTR